MTKVYYRGYVEIRHGEDCLSFEDISNGELKTSFNSIDECREYIRKKAKQILAVEDVTAVQIVEVVSKDDDFETEVVEQISSFDLETISGEIKSPSTPCYIVTVAEANNVSYDRYYRVFTDKASAEDYMEKMFEEKCEEVGYSDEDIEDIKDLSSDDFIEDPEGEWFFRLDEGELEK